MAGKTGKSTKKATAKKLSKTAKAAKEKVSKVSSASKASPAQKKNATKKVAANEKQSAKKKSKTKKPSTKKASSPKKSTAAKKASQPSNPVQNVATGAQLINNVLGIVEHLHHLAPALHHIIHSIGSLLSFSYQREWDGVRGNDAFARQQRARILLDATLRTNQLARLAELLSESNKVIRSHAVNTKEIAQQMAAKLTQPTTESIEANVRAAMATYERWFLGAGLPQSEGADRSGRVM